MKRDDERRFIGTIMLAAALMIASASPAFGKRARGPADRFDGPEATPSAAVYVGDCGPRYPRGYRYDLKNWRSGFADRDFSCYMLDEY
ncbi:hypothetical protein V3H18_12130 [Methylocystis sp. 9N]|uniref:Uncharacterized protein n=1 Tax=Methylocystis borbori TaxID=3118750 RepID=A0ABU7XJS7_9HYPH